MGMVKMPKKSPAPKIVYEQTGDGSDLDLESTFDYLFEKVLEEHKKSRL